MIPAAKSILAAAVMSVLMAGSPALAATTMGAAQADQTGTKANALWAKAETLDDAGKADEALAMYDKALAEDPDHVNALVGRGMNLARREKFDAAMEDLRRAVRLDPSQYSAYDIMGVILKQQGRPDEAIDAYTRALDANPDDLAALRYRAFIYVEQGDIAKARQDAVRVRDLDTDRTAAAYLLADIEVADGKLDAALKILEQAAADAPEDMDIRLYLADLLAACADPDPGLCVASREKAVAQYDIVIAAQPSGRLYASRATARPVADRKQIMADYDAAIALGDGYAPAYNGKAALLIEDKAYDQALPLLNQAIGLSPTDMDARGLRANVYFSTGRTAEGLAELDALKQDFPGDVWALNTSCGLRAIHNVELDTALADCKAGLAIAPDNVYLLDNLGFIGLRLGRYDDAIANYDRALALHPDLADSLYGRGIARLRKGDKAGGNADLNAARAVSDRVAADFVGYGMKP